jgi:hypothetical protein
MQYLKACGHEKTYNTPNDTVGLFGLSIRLNAGTKYGLYLETRRLCYIQIGAHRI